MQNKLKVLVTFLLSSFFLATPVLAHVKWFVDEEAITSQFHGLTPFYYLTSSEVITWSLVAVVSILGCAILDRHIRTPKNLLVFGAQYEAKVFRLAEALLGTFLVSTALLWQVIIVPNWSVDSSVTQFLLIVEVLTGLLMLFGVWQRLSSLALISLCIVVGYARGFEAFTENIVLLALAFVFFIRSFPKGNLWHEIAKHDVEIIRVGTGISLIVLAFTEKLMYPELGLSFLQTHHWNFMLNAGFSWFTDSLFVLSTGFVELIFGVIFILGYNTRINTVLIAGFFAVSVVTMLLQFNAWEVEDLVVYSAAVILLVYGSGQTRFYQRFWPKSIIHTHI